MKKKHIIFGLFIALVLAFVISPFASSSPDGLEKVAEQKGFMEREKTAVVKSPIKDYSWPVANMAGTLVVFFAGYGVAVLIKKK